jgi:hypothetical protein
MDPLSAIASAIAVLQLSGTIISACYDYRSRIKSAKQDASRITTELNGLRNVIESLLSVLEDEKEDNSMESSTLRQLTLKDGPLETCQADLESVSAKLIPKEGWRAIKASITWPLKESDVAKALHSIDSTKSTIQLALSTDQR